MGVHPTVVVSAEADISSTADIGPFCVIDGRVTIGAGTVVESHARIGGQFGEVVIGDNNHIQHGAVLGGPPQDLSYKDHYTRLEIGDDNRIGEFVSMHLGSDKGGGVTRVGNNNFLMGYCHLGHDCQLADDIVMTNMVQCSGHTIIERNAVLSGDSGTTQFVRIGEYAFLAGCTVVNKDVAPYTIAQGTWGVMRAANRVALKRAGFEEDEVRNISRAVRILLKGSETVDKALARIEAECTPSPQIEHFVAFIRGSERGIARK